MFIIFSPILDYCWVSFVHLQLEKWFKKTKIILVILSQSFFLPFEIEILLQILTLKFTGYILLESMEDDKRLIESYKTNSTGTRILHWKSIIVKFWSRFRKQLLMGLSILMVTLSLCVILSIIFTGGTAKDIWDKKQNIFQTPRNFVRNTELNCRGDCCSVRNISAPYRRLWRIQPRHQSKFPACQEFPGLSSAPVTY